MILDLNSVRDTYHAKNDLDRGITSVAFYCMNSKNWYDTLSNNINKELSKKIGILYDSYGCYKHITIMGLRALDKRNALEVVEHLHSFTSISIESHRVFMTPNGLIILEFYPTTEDKRKLEEYRDAFIKYNISYKYPNTSCQFHSVLGQIIPEVLAELSIEEQETMELEISNIFKYYNLQKYTEYFQINKDDIKIVKFNNTSLKGIASKNIFPLNGLSYNNLTF